MHGGLWCQSLLLCHVLHPVPFHCPAPDSRPTAAGPARRPLTTRRTQRGEGERTHEVAELPASCGSRIVLDASSGLAVPRWLLKRVERRNKGTRRRRSRFEGELRHGERQGQRCTVMAGRAVPGLGRTLWQPCR